MVQVGARFWGSEDVRADVVSISDESRVEVRGENSNALGTRECQASSASQDTQGAVVPSA